MDRSPPLVCTQIRAPARAPAFVARPRLVARVGAARVTLISGPAGSGKTTLVADWASQCGLPLGWVSLERDDDDPFRLWRAVLESLRATGAIPAGSTLAALEPPSAGSPDFPPAFINALAELPAPVALVLDDAHLLRSRAVRHQLGFVLLHMPTQLRLVLAARADPVLPLHVLRVRTSLGEIRTADLAFTPEEAAQLFAAHDVDLGAPSVATLHARAEGWAAGLRMAALSLQREPDHEAFVAAFAGDDRFVGDYLMAEILDRLPGGDRAFLLKTAAVDRVCGGLAEAMTGGRDGAGTLERLADTIGFVVRDEERWFRYHRLFGELLRAQSRRRQPGEYGAGHRRAAAWYAAQDMPLDALRHAGAAADLEHCSRLLAGHWLDLFRAGRRELLRSTLNGLPADLVTRDPELSAAAACAHFDAGDGARGYQHLAAAPEHAVARLCAARCDGDAAVAAEDGDALRLVSAGVAALWSCAFPRAEATLERARLAARAAGLPYLELDALAHLALARVLREGPALAAAPAADAGELARRAEWARTPAAAAASAALAYVACFEARPDQAEAHLADALRAAPEPRLRLALTRLQTLLDGARGRLPRAHAQAQALASAEHEPGAAAVEARVIEALARDASGESAGAVRTLEHALEAAEASGHRWAFTCQPGVHGLLLACIRAGTAHRALAGELLAAIENGSTGSATGSPALLRDRLTARESEILSHLPAGLSNGEIADALGLTVNTVKTHLRAIYQKLDATDRRDALQRAHELRLVQRIAR